MFKAILFHAFVMSLYLVSTSYGKPIPPYNSIKAIIWDAGYTLTEVSRWDIAREMGGKTIAGMLWHIGKPSTIQKTLFEPMEYYAGKQIAPAPEDLLSCDNGMPLPQFLSDTWLCSRIPNKELLKHISKAVDQWNPSEPVSQAQRKIIKKVLRTSLSAKILGKHTRCTKQALELVKKFDHSGYSQYILSNFEKEAFEFAYINARNRELFNYIPRKNIVISGDCGMIKPYGCIYEYFLEKYNLDPAECLLIDDRPENTKAARRYGIYAITLKNGDFKKLIRTLKEWRIL